MIFIIKSKDCDLCSFSPEEHKAFHRDAFLFNLSNQGTTQQVIEQLSKEDANPSNFSPQHIKNLAKTIKQNRATGQYLSTNANTGANASVNLLCHQRTQVTQKKYQKANKNAASQTSSSSHHNPAKRVVLHGKTTRESKILSLKVIAHDVVILNTKTTSGAQ